MAHVGDYERTLNRLLRAHGSGDADFLLLPSFSEEVNASILLPERGQGARLFVRRAERSIWHEHGRLVEQRHPMKYNEACRCSQSTVTEAQAKALWREVTVGVNVEDMPLPRALAEDIVRIWRAALDDVRKAPQPTLGFDGFTISISSRLHGQTGEAWAPQQDRPRVHAVSNVGFALIAYAGAANDVERTKLLADLSARVREAALLFP